MAEPFVPLGPFRLARRISRGGMAEVWSGVHAAQGVPVAVKVMTGERARQEQYRAAFRNEVQAVASLDHPGVVMVFDHGEVGPEAEEASLGVLPAGSPYLAMELADRGTLADLFPEAPSWSSIRTVLLALLDALAHAHARGVVHRDIKPTNVLAFDLGGEPLPRLKLADFGLAQAFEHQAGPDSTQFVCGTPSYMAPEQLRGEWRDYGPWTDLYSLGCLVWALVTGQAPFHEVGLLDLVRRQLEEAPPVFIPLAPVPRGFEGWLRRLLQKETGRRFVRAADATWALLALGEPVRRSSHAGRLALAETPTQLLVLAGLLPAAGRQVPGERHEERRGEETPAPRTSPPLPETWELPIPRPASMRLVGAGLGLYGLRSVPLVGRREERDLLWRTLAEVHTTGEARLVLLRGAAGHGKTRLAEWIAERAHEAGGAIVLRATHGPNPGAGDGLPRMLARHLRCLGLSREEILERTERLLRTRKVTDAGEWTGLTDLMVPGSSPQSPQTAPERFALLERHCHRLGRQRPVLILLDDVQWGSESIAFARHLLERRVELPVLLLLTVRDEALAERPREAAALAELLQRPGCSELEIPPLPAEDHAALVQELLGLAGDLAARVDQRTAGNPLFAVQLVGDWVQRGVLEVGDEGFVLRPGEQAWLPDDLHQVWSDRVDRLLAGHSAGSRSALEIAAALGTSIDQREWEAACRTAGLACPPGLLEALLASRLAVHTEDGWDFVHPMLRESIERLAYEAGRWQTHNWTCAAMLAPRAAAGERGIAERLGRHLLRAGDRAAALAHLLRGARERRETSDYAMAHTLLDWRDDALDLLVSPGHDPRRAEGWVLRARIRLHQGELDEVFRWAEQAETAAQSAGWEEVRSEALRLLGDAARRRGQLVRAASLYSRCIEIEANPHGAAASFWGLGDVARQRGDLARSRKLFDCSQQIYQEIGDEHGVADHLIGLADLARQQSDLAAAQDLYLEAEMRFEKLGNRYGVARGLNGLGEAARLQGDLARADAYYRRSLALLETLRSADEIFPRVNLALAALAGEDYGQAAKVLEESRERLEQMDWGGLLACVRVALLPCAAKDRDWRRWDDHFAAARAILQESGLQDPDVAWCAELAAGLAEAAGEESRAETARTGLLIFR